MYKRLWTRIGLTLNSIMIRCYALSRGSLISLRATVYIHSGGHLEIGRGVSIAQNAVLQVLPGAILELKDGCKIGPGVVIYCASRVSIGSQTRLAHYCSILDHDYDIHAGEPWFEKPKISSPIIIGGNTLIASYAVILKGVTIGDRCVIGAQTMVRKSVPHRMLAYCNSNSQLTLTNLIDG